MLISNGSAVCIAYDPESGKDKVYQWVPSAESIATFSLLHALPAIPEYVQRNSLPKESMLLTDGQVVMGHRNGSLMSSPDAVKSFIDSNDLNGFENCATKKTYWSQAQPCDRRIPSIS